MCKRPLQSFSHHRIKLPELRKRVRCTTQAGYLLPTIYMDTKWLTKKEYTRLYASPMANENIAWKSLYQQIWWLEQATAFFIGYWLVQPSTHKRLNASTEQRIASIIPAACLLFFCAKSPVQLDLVKTPKFHAHKNKFHAHETENACAWNRERMRMKINSMRMKQGTYKHK